MDSLNQSTGPDCHYEHGNYEASNWLGDQVVGVFVVAADMILMENNNYSMKTCTGDLHMFPQNRSFLPLCNPASRVCNTFFNSVTHFKNIDPVI